MWLGTSHNRLIDVPDVKNPPVLLSICTNTCKGIKQLSVDKILPRCCCYSLTAEDSSVISQDGVG